MSDDPSKQPEEQSTHTPGPLSPIQRALSQSSSDPPDVSAQVMAQFQSDLSNPLPCQYDFEFLSTYFDGELRSEFADSQLLHHRIQAFEQHLPLCDPCNEQLADLMTVSEAYRTHLYGLENQLEAWNIAGRVMARFKQAQALLDESVPLAGAGCGQSDPVLFSAYLDEELSEQEHGQLTAHIQECSLCQGYLTELKGFCEALNGSQQRLLTEPPLREPFDFWPVISKHLQEEPVDNVVLLSAGKKRRWVGGLAVTAAAAMLLAVFSGRLMSELQPQQQPGSPSVNVAALEAAMVADRQEMAQKGRAVIVPAQEPVINVAYSSPEAYLFSTETDVFSDIAASEDMSLDEVDVSAIVFSQ